MAVGRMRKLPFPSIKAVKLISISDFQASINKRPFVVPVQCLVVFAVVFKQYVSHVENVFNPKNRSGTFAAGTVGIFENCATMMAYEVS